MLDLTGNEICGVKAVGTDPFNPFVLKMVCALVVREEGGLRRLRLKGNHLIGNDVYTNEGVLLISEALRSPRCRLEELQLGLINKSGGLREEDGLLLGTAVQACASLVKLSVTRAELPMAELLHGSTSLDLEGKGLGRTEMGIAAQILRSNGTLRTLKLTDNCMGRHGLLALAEAVRAIRHAPRATRHAPRAMRHAPCAIRHPPCAMRHAPCAVRHPPSAIRHPPSAPCTRLSLHTPLSPHAPFTTPLSTRAPCHAPLLPRPTSPLSALPWAPPLGLGR